MLEPDMARQPQRTTGSYARSASQSQDGNDLIIGTYCIEHGHQLLHRDRDFDHMQQLGLQPYAG